MIKTATDAGYCGLLFALKTLSPETKLNVFLSAIRGKNKDLVGILAPHFEDFTTHDGTTPVMIAVENGDVDTLKILIDNHYHTGVTHVDPHRPSPLMIAVMDNKPECVKELIRNGDVDYRSEGDKVTPIMKAASLGNLEIVEILAPLTNPYITCSRGLSALSHAIVHNQVECARQLADFFPHDYEARLYARIQGISL